MCHVTSLKFNSVSSCSAASFTFAVSKFFNQLFFHARQMSLQSIGCSGPSGEVPRQKKTKTKNDILEVSLLHDQHIALLPTLGDLTDL